MAKAKPVESLADEAGETLLPEIDVARATDAELVDTAASTWSNARLREQVVARFAAMGSDVDALIVRAVSPPSAREGFVWSTSAAVTAVGIVERRATAAAIEHLEALAAERMTVVVAHARAALALLGKPAPPRSVEAPPFAELEAQLASGTPGQRALAIAYLVKHADLAVLPALREALLGSGRGPRSAAASACAILGDAACFGLLLRRLRDRADPPKQRPQAGGALPGAVADVLDAWNALVVLGDVRAFGEIDRFGADARFARLRFEHGSTDTNNFFERHPAGRLARRPAP